MAFEVKSVQEFEDDFRYNILLTTVLLLLFLFLEAFEKFTDQRSIQLLLKTEGSSCLPQAHATDQPLFAAAQHFL